MLRRPVPSTRPLRVALAAVLGLALATTGSAVLAAPGADDTSTTYLVDAFPIGGVVPDGASAACAATATGSFEVPITVAGVTQRITDVRVDIELAHTWAADVTVELVAPGGSPSFVLFEGTGRTSAASCGDNSDLGGAYWFSDQAPGAWWAAAASVDGGVTIPAGGYRTSQAGGTPGATGPATEMTPTFANLGSAANGVWTVRVSDRVNGDTGTVNSISLTLTVDTTRPSTTISSGPANGSRLAAAPTYTFSSPDEDLGGFECQIDAQAATPCTAPFTPSVAPGSHVVKIVAVDSSGNPDASAATRTFVLRDLPCEKATSKVKAAQKALKKAKKSGSKKKIAKAKRLLKKAKKAKAKAC